MGATFIIMLREGFEAALLLGIVYSYLSRIGAAEHYRYVTRGAAVGVLASVALGMAVSLLSGPLLDLGSDVIAIGVIFVAVVVLTWHGYWMHRHGRSIKGEVQRRIDDAQATRRLWIVGVIAFTGVFREGAEAVLFLWGLITQAGSASGWSAATGGVLGMVVAAALGWTIFRGSKHVSLPRFFLYTSALLLLLAAGLLSTGVGKLEAFGLLAPSPMAWDTSSMLSDQSLAGEFLGGLVGYRARPSMLEAGAYVAYLLLAVFLVFGDLRWTKTRSRDRLPAGTA
jgi:high-affinity iron transporter